MDDPYSVLKLKKYQRRWDLDKILNSILVTSLIKKPLVFPRCSTQVDTDGVHVGNISAWGHCDMTNPACRGIPVTPEPPNPTEPPTPPSDQNDYTNDVSISPFFFIN